MAAHSQERELYQRFLHGDSGVRAGRQEEIRTTPLFSFAAKEAVEDNSLLMQNSSWMEDAAASETDVLGQYALVGFNVGQDNGMPAQEPILLNVDAPNSAFICGSQGSGKSYTLSCLLENCLLTDPQLGTVQTPVAGIAFHYDLDSSGSIAETAYLCSRGIKINVLVSRSNEHVLRHKYSMIPGAKDNLTVRPLVLDPTDLSIERIHRLMAVAKDGKVPLYMEVARRILREMAIEAQNTGFDYKKFKQLLDKENFTHDQVAPLRLRLELLESFLDMQSTEKGKASRNVLRAECGTLTIIDLTDPFMDASTVCLLFDICLSLMEEHRPAQGLVLALDEAHKYLNESHAATNFTDRLLRTIREQRHNATRVIIATQEPTISEKLLDLCSVSIVHRFTSPSWFKAIQGHLGGASKLASESFDNVLFEQIMTLPVGHSLVFAPSAFCHVHEDGQPRRLGARFVQMKTRKRIGVDGGTSILASAQIDSIAEDRNNNGVKVHATMQPDAVPSLSSQRKTKKSAGDCSNDSSSQSSDSPSEDNDQADDIYADYMYGSDTDATSETCTIPASPPRTSSALFAPIKPVQQPIPPHLKPRTSLEAATAPQQTLVRSVQSKVSGTSADKARKSLGQISKTKAPSNPVAKAKNKAHTTSSASNVGPSTSSNKNEPAPTLTNAHLALICCMCEAVAIVEFSTKLIPTALTSCTEKQKHGIAYATCFSCRQKASDNSVNHVSSTEIDRSMKKNFKTVFAALDPTFRQELRKCFKTCFEHQRLYCLVPPTGEIAYVLEEEVMRVSFQIQMKWTARLNKEEIARKGTVRSMALLRHQYGDFFAW